MKFNRILIVEDEPCIRKALAELLSDYNVITAENGQIGLELLANDSEPCLIILDYHMPVMDGRGFMRELRKYDAESIVYLHSATDARIDGVNGYIQKPCSIDSILELAKERVHEAAEFTRSA